MHGMIGDADNPSADTGEDCAHDREIITSIVPLVEEDIDPFDFIVVGRIRFKLAHGNSILIKHLTS